MLKLLLGRSGSGKTTKLREMVRDALRRSPESPVFLIVPEQASFENERAMLELLGAEDAQKVHVLSFSRLADEGFRRYGGGAGQKAGRRRAHSFHESRPFCRAGSAGILSRQRSRRGTGVSASRCVRRAQDVRRCPRKNLGRQPDVCRRGRSAASCGRFPSFFRPMTRLLPAVFSIRSTISRACFRFCGNIAFFRMRLWRSIPSPLSPCRNTRSFA